MDNDNPVKTNRGSDEAELCLELPDLDDVDHPVLKRAVARIESLKNEPASLHQKHSSHDRSGHVSGYW
jgi:hypothetical protein